MKHLWAIYNSIGIGVCIQLDKEKWVHIFVGAKQDTGACANENMPTEVMCHVQEKVSNNVSSTWEYLGLCRALLGKMPLSTSKDILQ